MKNLLLLFSLFGFFVFATSCSDDDEVDCDALEEQYIDATDEYVDACLTNYDCEECKNSINALIGMFDEGKACIDEEDLADFEEQVEALEAQLDQLDC